MIAEVIVDITHSEVDRVFDYEIGNVNAEVGSRVSVPFANRKIEGIVIKIKQNSDVDKQKLKSVIEVLDDLPALTSEMIKLTNYIATKYHVTKASALRLFLPSEMRKGKVSEKMVEFASLNCIFSFDEMVSSLNKNAKQQLLAINYLNDNKKARLSQLRSNFGQTAIKSLIEKNYLLIENERICRLPYSQIISLDKNITLVNQQIKAVESVNKSDKCVTLIHGVTGSGKTEVYLELIKQVIENGKTAIMLVPEISLTPQMLTRFRGRFNELCAILHSGLSAGERFDEWWRLRLGEAKIAIGARSAIFAPLENVGLIIIDEQHDSSYESETTPRYSTMDIALKRAQFNNCKVVIGSATPSVESYLNAKNGVYNLACMNERINKKPLPEIIVADMRDEVRRGNNSFFSSSLKYELQEVLDNNNQAIIFLNRRGYSQQIICRGCGYVAKCTSCDVSLNYHKAGNMLKCHYCGTNYKMLQACPECGSTNIAMIGTGTQKVVDQLKELFPTAKILRMDNDTTQNKEGHYKILSAFANHEADILVGTQMIAKGHDFPSVTLVGILDGDMSLYFSDYRSNERTFQLLTQVAGRSGRANSKGKVVLQTYSPDNSILKYAMNYDYQGFFNREIAVREATHFPPYAVILRVMIESSNDEKALNTLKSVFFALENIYRSNKEKFIFFNKMKSPVKFLKNKYRYQVLMRIFNDNQQLIDEIYSESLKYNEKDVFITIEENPNNLS